MDPQQPQQQTETLKQILHNFEKSQIQPKTQNPSETENQQETQNNPQNLKKIQKKEIENLKRELKTKSILAKREQLRSEEFEEKLENMFKSEILIKKKLKISDKNKAILISRLDFLNNKDISRKEEGSNTVIKELQKELRNQKSALTIRESEYNLSLIQSEKLEKEANMWKNLYEKSSEIVEDLAKNFNHFTEVADPNEPEEKEKNFLKEILESEENIIGKLSIFEDKGEIEIAEKIFENDLLKLKEILNKENELEEDIKNLKKTHEEKEKNMDEKYSKLLEKFEKAKDIITKSENFCPENLNFDFKDEENVKKLVQKFLEIREKYTSLKTTVKNYAENWTKNLRDSSNKDHQVIKLRKIYQKLEKSYKSLEEKMKKKFEKEIIEKINIRDNIIEDQGHQIQNLLYQNHKLREHIFKETGEMILPLNNSEFKKSSLIEKQDRIVYNTIEEQTEQIKILRKKLYLINNRVEETIEKSSKKGISQDPYGENGAQENSNSYSHPYNALLKRYQKSKKEVLKLQKETSTWKETTQKLLSEKSELQTKYRNLQNSSRNEIVSLKSKVENYEKLKNDLILKLTTATSQNSGLEIDMIQNKQRISNYEKEVKDLKEKNFNLEELINKQNEARYGEEKIWDSITIILENSSIEEEGNLKEEKEEIISLLKELREDFSLKIAQVNTGIKKDIIITQYKEHCKMLEGYITQLKKTQKLEYSKTKKIIEEISKSLKCQKTEDILTSISLSSDLETFCPSLLCLKLNKQLKETEKKYEKLRSEMLGKNTVKKEKELENLVKDLSQKLAEVMKAYQQEIRDKEELMKMIEGKDKGVYDAIKFRKIIEENKELKKAIDDLKFELIKEKKISNDSVLELEESHNKINTLSQKISKLHDKKTEILSQLSIQNSLNEIKRKEQSEKIVFLNSENGLLKIKIEKIVEGVKHLKKYMYDSLSPEEKEADKEKLSTLDTVISNISQNLIKVKKEYQIKSNILNQNSLSKIDVLTSQLEDITKRRVEQAGEDKKEEDLEKLKEEIERLREDNRTFEERIKASQEIIGKQQADRGDISYDRSLLQELTIDRITNAIQTNLDIWMIKNNNSGGNNVNFGG